MKRPTTLSHLSRRDAMILGLGGLAAGSALLRPGAALAQTNLQWGSSSVGSTGYVIMEGLASIVNRHTNLSNTSMATSGGAENMQLFKEGIIQFGQTTSTDWLPAFEGREPYPEPIEVHQMFAYTLFNCTPMVRADSDIQSIEDLVGRRVMPSPAGSSTAVLFEVLFEAAGILDRIDWTYGSWRETYDALRAGNVDCIPSLLTNGRPAPIMTELMALQQVRILPVSDELLARAGQINGGARPGIIPAAAIAGASADMSAASFSGVLAAAPEVSEEVAYTLMTAIFDNLSEVHALGVQFADIAADFGAANLVGGYPIHKGAARFFKERGLWQDGMIEAE